MSQTYFRSEPLRGGGNGDIRSLKYPVALFLIVFAVLVAAFAVSESSDVVDAASSGDDGNIHWDISGNTLTLSKKTGQGSGAMNDYESRDLRPDWETGDGWSAVRNVAIQDGVTYIGEYAFHKDEMYWPITTVTIPGSVLSIGNYAFFFCDSLSTVNIANGVESIGEFAFQVCNLTAITIPGSVKYIGEYAFLQCRSLQYVNIPDSVTTLGENAFNDCESLSSVTFGDGCQLTTISEGVFSECISLSSVTIPGSVKSIGNYAFNNCTNLSSINNGNGVESIGESAFANCTSLSSVTLGDNVVSIGPQAFSNCTALESVDVPAKVGSIGERAFERCAKLEQINVADDSQNYSSVNGVLFNKDKTELIAYPQGLEGHYDVPDGVTSIKGHAFYTCNIASVTLPGSITTVGQFAFFECENLNVVYINASILDITGGWPTNRDILFIYANGGYVTGGAMDASDKKFPSADDFIGPGGKGFEEYKTVKEGTGTSYKPGDEYSLTGKQIVYAIWQSSQHTVTFNANGGSCDTATMNTDGEGKLSSLPTATRDRYTFGGWYTQAEGGEEITTSYIFTQDTTVYAHWNVIHVTAVTLDKTSVSLEAGKTAKLVATVTPSDATAQTVTWTTSDASIAKVSSDGTITAIKAGTVTIKAVADGKEAACTVTVTDTPAPTPSPGDGNALIATVCAVLVAMILVIVSAVTVRRNR